MSMKYVREYYQVPVKRGSRILFKYTGQYGTVKSVKNGKINVQFDGDIFTRPLHPTWMVEWLEHEKKGL